MDRQEVDQANINTERYVLMLRISHNNLTCVSYQPAEDDSMRSFTIALSADKESQTTSIEQAIYAHEELLQPYAKVYVVIESNHFMFVPNDLATRSDNSAFYSAIYRNDSQEQVLESHLPHIGAVMLWGVDARLVSFLNRTFDTPTLLHPLIPLCEYFYRKSSAGNQRKVFVHLYKGRADVVCMSREGLLLANTYSYRHSNDAAYHVLNVWKQLGLDQRRDEVHVAGEIATRRDMSALLRNYIHTVVPVIFPSHCLVLGSDAMQIPFDLTALSLCEL